MTYYFRKLTSTDFPLLLKWLKLPHVLEWWNDGDDTLEKVAQHYGTPEAGVERFILIEIKQEKELPLGYFQYYQAEAGSIGIDQFLGSPESLNQGLGTQTIQAFITRIRQEKGPVSILVDPEPENKRAIRCYEKVGFQYAYTVPSVDKPGKSAYIMIYP
ncbi:GNAT family N-acetyltransferase [bacterium (Candidatus Blackallbacteria) CG17_big_fil_post_rev_8_21_14_2_50_48_46]|uniref:GNAT family N-acetyltransferase n=1 Tax=bacterium (Candidatus Blackallbacteria) CG17_big_fil_post_rev_8_21_14_2_50_48_46 TaxID=2014261 RepID=A0A2M7G6B3_9BACT|nr:MAG: GNAT family N-acetyltransferase [bacterium (Candidatus Blackallbacteria) CG18_big_fil_WC_8_21_14_2_50_49_26]PIW17535.1 MAG: GNAT family N-acetyltransferase [bacterium (Candidatus Blackallbacteria) CG17_big_fil_post_rev_8_21_14_2_50_48_46]PIW48390.1 MAG: GNAT family N-acetyltransferase [bacterium (Candidatus Blackallbacteria) CG13_big_fil_rev_8_21_14_2_50_49_14]